MPSPSITSRWLEAGSLGSQLAIAGPPPQPKTIVVSTYSSEYGDLPAAPLTIQSRCRPSEAKPYLPGSDSDR